MQKRLFLLLTVGMIALASAWGAKKFTLVIDAGHGGHDAGAVGSFSKEKNINLNTALAFGRYVERNCPDVNVIYTRKTDVFVTLHGRAEIANKAKADLFISIHTNALPGGKIGRGLETYTLGMHRAGDNLDVAKRENSVILVEKDYQERYQGFDPNSAESYIIFEFMQDHNMQKSIDMAKLIQRNVASSAGRPDKGVKQAGFLVLRETSMPSCLIELGFISTPDEEHFLNSEAGIENTARGIYQAFVAYKRKYDSNITVPYKAEETATVPTVVPESPKKTEPAVQKKTTPAVKKGEPSKKNEAAKKPDSTAVKKVEAAPAKKTETAPAKKLDAPVFKVQIFVSPGVVRNNDSRLKGVADASYYKEGGMMKYTVGESADYNEIYRLRKTLLEKFPDCFIVAFKDGEKMNINEAIREFKSKR